MLSKSTAQDLRQDYHSCSSIIPMKPVSLSDIGKAAVKMTPWITQDHLVLKNACIPSLFWLVVGLLRFDSNACHEKSVPKAFSLFWFLYMSVQHFKRQKSDWGGERRDECSQWSIWGRGQHMPVLLLCCCHSGVWTVQPINISLHFSSFYFRTEDLQGHSFSFITTCSSWFVLRCSFHRSCLAGPNRDRHLSHYFQQLAFCHRILPGSRSSSPSQTASQKQIQTLNSSWGGQQASSLGAMILVPHPYLSLHG